MTPLLTAAIDRLPADLRRWVLDRDWLRPRPSPWRWDDDDNDDDSGQELLPGFRRIACPD